MEAGLADHVWVLRRNCWQWENDAMDTSDRFKGEVRCPPTLEDLLTRLRRLHERRRRQHEQHRAKKRRRSTLRGKARQKVLKVNRQAVPHLWWVNSKEVGKLITYWLSAQTAKIHQKTIFRSPALQPLSLGLWLGNIPMEFPQNRYLGTNADEKQFTRQGTWTADGREVLWGDEK